LQVPRDGKLPKIIPGNKKRGTKKKTEEYMRIANDVDFIIAKGGVVNCFYDLSQVAPWLVDVGMKTQVW